MEWDVVGAFDFAVRSLLFSIVWGSFDSRFLSLLVQVWFALGLRLFV